MTFAAFNQNVFFLCNSALTDLCVSGSFVSWCLQLLEWFPSGGTELLGQRQRQNSDQRRQTESENVTISQHQAQTSLSHTCNRGFRLIQAKFVFSWELMKFYSFFFSSVSQRFNFNIFLFSFVPGKRNCNDF